MLFRSEIDLTGWKFNDGSNHILNEPPKNGGQGSLKIGINEYVILADDAGAFLTNHERFLGTVIDTAMSLKNASSSLKIFDSEDKEDKEIKSVTYQNSWGGNGNNRTLEKIDPQGDNSQSNWSESFLENGTPGADNSVGKNNAQDDEDDPPTDDEEPDEPEEPEEKPDEPPDGATSKLGDVVINEFVSDPDDEDVEWIELYNKTSKIISLIGWSVYEGSGAKTNLEGDIGFLGSDRFFVIEKPSGNLNNKGDIIILRDASDNLIDQVAYGEWDDGQLDNNAPVIGDPNSVARKFDGQNSYNNENDFAITISPTKGESNIIEDEESETENLEYGDYDYSDDIIISEIFPNPEGSDNEDEFIELYNSGDMDVNLLGWRLGDESKKRFEFKEERIISPDGHLVIYRSESKIALNNTGDSVKLFQPQKDEPFQIIKYEKAIEDWSYAKASDHKWSWTEMVTAGEENIIKTINHPPEVNFDCPEDAQVGVPIIFDSSDTVDEDEDELKYSWDFGDGFTNILPIPQHTFLSVGAYTVKLIVNDGENEVEEEKIVRVVSIAPSPDPSPTSYVPTTSLGTGAGEGSSLEWVIINEFLPNPEGSDAKGEFIELYNQGSEQINLLNWTLDDIEGGSKPYKFVDDVWLLGNTYYLVERAESGLALNNSNDAVRLYNDLDELIDEVEYEASFEGESYARGQNGKWFWTTAITPAEENVISVADSNLDIKVLGVSNIKAPRALERLSEPAITTLEKIREFEAGDLVIVKGVVAVLPGILGSQYFYIVTPSLPHPDPLLTKERENAEEGLLKMAGLQIYSYKKDFPNLRVGDYVEVHGELSEVNGELRLKTKEAQDINILEYAGEPIAEETACDKINEEYIGSLIKVTGEIVERKSSSIYLDDGLDEVLIYLKKTTGINPKSFNEGEIIKVTGIVSRTKSGIRIMPRSDDDIIKKDVESTTGEEGRILGETAESNEWAIEAIDKKIELFKYLLVVATAVIVLLGGLLVKSMRKS